MAKRLSVEKLRQYLRLDEQTGHLFWIARPSNRVKVGDRAGAFVPSARARQLSLCGVKFSAAQAVFALSHGEWPSERLIHVNGDPDDQRLANLRYPHSGDPEDLTAARVRQLFGYDSETGVITRLMATAPNVSVGETVGSSNGYGYLSAGADGRNYLVHRLAWMHYHGSWPKGRIDHINGNQLDNRISNLRDATPAVNSQNQRRPHRCNKTGLLGVCPVRGGWKAQISIGGITRSIGRFETPEAAHVAYIDAKRKHHEGNTL